MPRVYAVRGSGVEGRLKQDDVMASFRPGAMLVQRLVAVLGVQRASGAAPHTKIDQRSVG